MNYTELEKQKVEKILSDLDLSGSFALSESNELEIFELKKNVDKKIFKVMGCYPLLFCNSKRHTLLNNKQVAENFFKFEKIDLSNVRVKGLRVDFECSSLKIITDHFDIIFFPNENWGWAIQYDGENFLLEALEYGGIEIRKY